MRQSRLPVRFDQRGNCALDARRRLVSDPWGDVSQRLCLDTAKIGLATEGDDEGQLARRVA